MKKIVLMFANVFSGILIQAQSFVSPINFIDNEENREKVIAFIEKPYMICHEPACRWAGYTN